MKDEKNDKINQIDETELEEMDETVVFSDEDGNEIEFTEIAYFEYEGNAYSALVPVEISEEDTEEGDPIYFCTVTEDEDGYEVLEMVEDEALLDKLYAEFLKIQEEEGCDCGCHDHDCCDCGDDE